MNLVQDQLSDQVVSKIGSMIGAGSGSAKGAIASALPSILKAVVMRGDTQSNASSLLSFLKDKKLGGDLNLDTMMDKGGDALDFLYGNEKSSFLGDIASKAGISSEIGTKLSSVLAPMALNQVSSLVSKEGLNDVGLASYLNEQKASLLGTSTSGAAASTATTTAARATESNSGGGMGWIKWLIPLLAAGALIWYLSQGGCSGATANADGTEMNESGTHTHSDGTTHTDGDAHADHDHEGHSHEGHSHEGHDHEGTDGDGATASNESHEGHDHSTMSTTTEGVASTTVSEVTSEVTRTAGDAAGAVSSAASAVYTVNAGGDLVDASGKVAYKAGEFKVEGDHYVTNDGKKIGFFKKVGKAIGQAATKTADAFSSLFSGMFKAKEKVGATHNLGNLAWKDGHKISSYSVEEVKGLALALKANSGAKIQVQGYANDQASAGKNKEVAKLRANVIYDLLKAHGVPDSQISFKGMGDGGNKVDIKVETTVD